MYLLNLFTFDATKLTLGLGALLVILGICLLWFSIVERRQINRRKKMQNDKTATDESEEELQAEADEVEADEVEAQNAVETMAEIVEEADDETNETQTVVNREIAVDDKGETVVVEYIAQPVATDEPTEEGQSSADETVADDEEAVGTTADEEAQTVETEQIDEHRDETDVDEQTDDESDADKQDDVATVAETSHEEVAAEEVVDEADEVADVEEVINETEEESEIEDVADKADEEQEAEAEEDKGVSVVEAHTAMTDEYATSHMVIVARTAAKASGKKAVVNIDTIGANFNDGDTVDLAALKAKKLVSRKETAVKILARGWLGKKLNVIADDFSADAVKMILLTGGTVTKI